MQEVYYPISPYAYAGNNPVLFVDVNGEYVGTVTGLVSGAIMGAVMAAIDGQNIYSGLVKGAVVGGIAGAAFDISVATLGTAPAAVIAAGAISGAVGSMAGQLMETGQVSAGQVAVSAAAGGALGYAGGKLAPIAGRMVSAAGQAVESTSARAVGSLANSAIRSIGSYGDDIARGGISLADEVANNAARAGKSLVTKYPANPAIASTTERTFLMPGEVIDRYGALSGKWFSTPGTSYGARSIPPELSPYTRFKVLKPFEVQKSLASPGMFNGQIGFGIQFQSPVGANILIKRGVIMPF